MCLQIVFDEEATDDMEVDNPATEDEDDSWMMPDEGDEVVKELDVCVSTKLAPHLQVLQFPLRPKTRQFENNKDIGGGIKLRCKPKVWILSPVVIPPRAWAPFSWGITSFSSLFSLDFLVRTKSLRCTFLWTCRESTMIAVRVPSLVLWSRTRAWLMAPGP